jgi:hypothetical protein
MSNSTKHALTLFGVGIALASLGFALMHEVYLPSWIPTTLIVSAILFTLTALIVFLLPYLKSILKRHPNIKSTSTLVLITLYLIILVMIPRLYNWIDTLPDSHPLPQQIINGIDKGVDPQGYKDISVKWRVIYSSKYDNGNNTFDISCFTTDSSFIIIKFTIDKQTYPEFNSIEDNQRLLIQGKISKVFISTIYLDVKQINLQ